MVEQCCKIWVGTYITSISCPGSSSLILLTFHFKNGAMEKEISGIKTWEGSAQNLARFSLEIRDHEFNRTLGDGQEARRL